MKVVIKLSGKVFDNPSKESLKEYALLFASMLNDGIQSIVIAGGGPIARSYISLARELGYDESSLDELGIIVSRLNARLLIAALQDKAYSRVPETLDEIRLAVESNKIVVTGGLHVGQSTNATAAIIAERIGADLFINATDVDGIYSADPRKYKDAKLFESISIKALTDLLIDQSTSAGEYDLMDIVALKIIERSKINTIVVRSEPKIIREAISGNVGTRILT